MLLAIAVFVPSAQAQSPSGWWKFDDGSGTTAIDSSGNGHTATLVNGVSWVPGKIGDAVSANAAQRQYVSIPLINFTQTRAVTVALWTNRTYSTGGGHTLFEATTNFNNSTTGFALFPDSASCGGIEADLRGNVGYVANCYSQPSSGVWHHLAVVYDKTQTGGNEVTLYLDGVFQPANWSLYSSTNTNAFGNNPIYLFSRGGASEFNSGIADDLRVYNSALTASQIQQIYNAGNLQGTLSASPATLNFGSVNLNNSLPETVTVTNTGSAAATIMSVSISGAEFSLSPISTPLTLQPLGSVPLTITFTPTVVGPATGTVSVTSNATDPVLNIPLTGTGVSNGPHSVALSWTASTSPVVGYNVYRSTTSGGPYTKLNTTLIPSTSYNDQNVQSGMTYYYVATAVNSAGLESAYSNQAVAVIP